MATPPPPPAQPTPPPPAEEPIEWRASIGGATYGPTVPTVFGQWIREGRVTPDTLVWRTGWDDWRRAADAAELLPAPFGRSGPPQAEPVVDRVAGPTGTAATPRAAASAYARRRSARARRVRTVAVALVVVCVVLVGMLLWLTTGTTPTPD